MMISYALVIGGAAVAFVLLVLASGRKRGPSPTDLGTISQQWIAQHRAQSRDSQR